jgi:hypothetical protein
MTTLQKEIITELLNGGNISGNKTYGYRLRTSNQVCVRKFHDRTLYRVKDVLRKSGSVYVINKSKVRQLHGSSWIKQHYKSITNVESN